MMTAQHPLLPESLSYALGANGINLNSLQHAALDAALRGLDVVIHAETGSGKTFCFALPLLAKLSPDAADSLQGVVLVPTLELAAQVARVLNTLQAGSAIAFTPGLSELPAAPVLVGPPAMMLRLLSGGEHGVDGAPRIPKASVRCLSTVVLDEADALMMPLGRYATLRERLRREEKPKEATALLEQLCAVCGDGLQVLAASATVGRPLRRMMTATCEGRVFEVVRDSGPAAVASNADGAAATDGLDADDKYSVGVAASSGGGGGGVRAIGLPSGVSVTVVTSEADNVLAAIHDVLRAEGAAAPLLFIPPGRSLQAELQLLRQCALDAVALDAVVLDSSAPLAAHKVAAVAAQAQPALPAQPAMPALAPAALGSSGGSSGGGGGGGGGGGAGPTVLVASPSGARGLDLPGIDLVLILGVPPSADALVHMAGRTGRQGRPGRVAILATAKEADRKLPLMSSQLGLEIGAERRHVEARDEVWAETWRVHGKRYERELDQTPFYAHRPRGRPAAGPSGRGKGRGGGPAGRKPKTGRGSAKARRRVQRASGAAGSGQ